MKKMSQLNFIEFRLYDLLHLGLVVLLGAVNPNVYSQECSRVVSSSEDPTSAQITGTELTTNINEMKWVIPSESTYKVAFDGVPGTTASHEGIDFVHDDISKSLVDVKAAAAGTVVYVREGCPESSIFEYNNYQRECGAGCGNHVVVKHGEIYTRYAHLKDKSVLVNVGDFVECGERIAYMGNSGRSELRHMHFELGVM